MGQAAKPTRQNRTITVDFQDEATYFQLLGDTQAFVGPTGGKLRSDVICPVTSRVDFRSSF